MSEEAVKAAESGEDTASHDEVSYQAVEKDGVVTAIWEMQGRKHVRTIDPRSEEGRQILGTYTVDESHEGQSAQSQANQ